MTDEKPLKFDLLLILRGLACMLVVFSHAWALVPSDQMDSTLTLFGTNIGWAVRGHGDMGVWLFFVLSGYLMGKAFWSGRYTLTGDGIFSFFANRALRILPLYWLSIAVAMLVVDPSLRSFESPVLLELLTFRFQGGSLGPLWTISTEVQFYVLVPLLFFLLRPLLTTKPRILAFAVSLIAIHTTRTYSLMRSPDWSRHVYWYKVYAPLLPNLAIFLLGFALNPWLALSRSKPRWPRALPRKVFVSIAALFIFAGWCGSYLWRTPGIAEYGSVALPFITAVWALIMIYIAEKGSLASRKLPQFTAAGDCPAFRPVALLEWLGILTYGIYLWHVMVVLTVVKQNLFFGPPLFVLGATLSTILFSAIALAILTYFGLEAPAERFKRAATRATRPV